MPGLTFAPPEDGRIGAPRVRLVVLDATHVVLESYYDALEWEHPDHHRWYTSDAGHSWAEVPVTPVATVDELPADGYVYADTDPQTPQGVVLRAIRTDGTSVVAATEVSRPGLFLGRLVDASNGTLWLRAMNDSNLVTLVRSDDRGRSWVDVALPVGHPVAAHQYEFETADCTTAYLVDGTAFRLWRSSDSGTTWAELDVPFEPAAGRLLRGRLLPDGRFVLLRPVQDAAGVRYEYLAITPTGSAFEPAEAGDFLLLDVPVVGPRVGENLEIVDELGVRRADGSWTPLPFPCDAGRCW